MANDSSKRKRARARGLAGVPSDERDHGETQTDTTHGGESNPTAVFLKEVESYFMRDKSLREVAKALEMDVGQVRRGIRNAFKERLIRIQPPRNDALSAKLAKEWDGPKYYVLNAEDDQLFFAGAAEVFFEELRRVLESRAGDGGSPESPGERSPLRIGLVSGRTTGGTVKAICDASWAHYFPRSMLSSQTSGIEIYALNVSQTDGYKQLRGNANVLAFLLADKFERECSNLHVEAYGLSTDLLQTLEDARRTDVTPQIKKIIKQTDPERLRESYQKTGQTADPNIPAEPQLDIIIVGAGSVKDSLFKTYCRENQFDLDRLEREQAIVGDIGYWPVSRNGKRQPLTKRDGDREREYVFYSAMQLETLNKVVRMGGNRKVILVARNTPDTNKVDPIYAAIGGRMKYCNVLVTDHKTAHEILTELGRGEFRRI
jgi:DNA-binding transcriptional regulator LsrR (DeoR family)